MLHKCIKYFKTKRILTEKFSISEKHLLQRKLGNNVAMKDCAQKTGIRRATLARLLKTGEARPATMHRLRIYLYTLPVRVFIEDAA